MKFLKKDVKSNGKTIQYTLITQKSDQLVIVLPGAGYTAQAPWLYYSTSLFVEKDYDVLHVNYSYTQNEFEVLGATGFSQDVCQVINQVVSNYKEIIFCAKSLGTLALSHIIDEYQPSYSIWLTPLLQRDDVYQKLIETDYRGLIVIGDEDPCYIEDRFNDIKDNSSLRLTLIKGANHGLELKDQHSSHSIDVLKDYLNQLDHILC
ncbi:alpha/beta family hydrolase [Piscibacillus halophilus]|uniref:alpha/beta family hydrolase n=1 Tax=Piscibacillus halophilus TaxID=571933 RepID=UPI0024099580|nr:alpha/beta hydrolase [Piscibacillus halophilus]